MTGGERSGPSGGDPGEGDVAPRELLVALATLFGNLLLVEVDERMLELLREETLAPVLAEWEIVLPTPEEEGAWIEERAAEYHDLFLRPETGPLVQSLWAEGRYEGEAAVRVRALAEAAGASFGAEAARGAPVDHLGSLLLLWAACAGPVPRVAEEIAAAHLDWAVRALEKLAATPGLYGRVAAACGLLVGVRSRTPCRRFLAAPYRT